MEVISEKLGHSRPSTTANISRHIYLEEHERHPLALTELLTPAPLRLRSAERRGSAPQPDDQMA